MLQSLHVKNLSLMEETEVNFGPGLNILTGETGAGKSLLIGSISLALGAKFEKDMLRQGTDTALVELIFSGTDEKVRNKLAEMDLDEQEDGTVLISRKMQVGKSVCKINGETVTAKQVKELAEYLIDIHGQHEHQSLLNKKKHLEILDAFCGRDDLREKVSELYRKSRELERKIEEEAIDESTRQRQQSLAEFEWQEIENARLIPGEDEELEKRYRLMINSKKIVESLAETYSFTGNGSNNAGESVSRALRAMRGIAGFDDHIADLEQQLADIEDLLSGFNRDIADYMSDCEFDDETFQETEDRLNELNRLKGKYGKTLEEVLQYGEDRKTYLDKLADYDAYMAGLRLEYQKCYQELEKACEELSKARGKEAKTLSLQLKDALIHLNFLTVEFSIDVRSGQTITAKGWDDVEFMITTNPGEPLKSLSQVASGGELSRIMLALKTVMAGRDDIDTLIFDEIDAGISGRTAWCVSEQLNIVAGAHQVICITHLPQIAAMADNHFCIEKSSRDSSTITDIRKLEEEDSLCELARLLGSDSLNEAALQNAKEMRNQALQSKKNK